MAYVQRTRKNTVDKVTYVTTAGDRIDSLCYAHYGTERRSVEWLIEKNPHLRQYTLYLPEGVTIVFYPLPVVDIATVNPWS